MSTTNNSNNPSLASAIARLERAGAENSRTTHKLRAAAAELGRWIDATADLPGGLLSLPRGYRTDDAGWICAYVPATETYLRLAGDILPRAVALKLAQDVAEGWLQELTIWITARAVKSEESADVLAAALSQQQAAPALAIAAALEDLGNKADDLALTLPNGAEAGGLIKGIAYDLQDMQKGK